jgi:hypothetical protein
MIDTVRRVHPTVADRDCQGRGLSGWKGEKGKGYSVQCTVYSVQCTVYSVQCTVQKKECNVSVYNIQYATSVL